MIVSTTIHADTKLTHGAGEPGRAWVRADSLAFTAPRDDLLRLAAECIAAANLAADA